MEPWEDRADDLLAEMLPDFLDESTQLVKIVDEQLRGLQASAAAGESVFMAASQRARVNELFRAVHSIKGASGMLGLRATSDLTHHLETLLDDLRGGQLPLNDALLNVFFQGVDDLTLMINRIREQGPLNDSNDGDRLEAWLAKARAAAPGWRTAKQNRADAAPAPGPEAACPAAADHQVPLIDQEKRLDEWVDGDRQLIASKNRAPSPAANSPVGEAPMNTLQSLRRLFDDMETVESAVDAINQALSVLEHSQAFGAAMFDNCAVSGPVDQESLADNDEGARLAQDIETMLGSILRRKQVLDATFLGLMRRGLGILRESDPSALALLGADPGHC